MATKDLGNKHTCFRCSAKFYDLKRPDPVCPKCGANQKESPANKPAESRRSRLAPVKPVLPEAVPDEPAETDEDEDEDDFEDAEIPDEEEET
ncbi:MAG: TIGR02300 family protein [Deltaproteobacteria bacterium]|nr:TIGR02300 family protein [Deltaproteobacteria bacterium]